MKEIKEIAVALRKGDVAEAARLQEKIPNLGEDARFEIEEVVRQAIISYLKKGDVKLAREAEEAFGLSKDSVNDTIKQAVLSSFRDGDLETVHGLKRDLPIPSVLGKEIIEYCSTWGKHDFTACVAAVLA